MLDFFAACILIIGIGMSGFKRIKLLNTAYRLQSLAIALFCLCKAFFYDEYHFYIVFALTFVAKVIIIPFILNKASNDLKANREMDPILSGHGSYIISGLSVIIAFIALSGFVDPMFKVGAVLVIVGIILLIARRKAIIQMIGMLTLENGIVLFEISMIKMGFLIEFGIIFEILMLALIMGMMILRINKTFNSINTDYLSNLKE